MDCEVVYTFRTLIVLYGLSIASPNVSHAFAAPEDTIERRGPDAERGEAQEAQQNAEG